MMMRGIVSKSVHYELAASYFQETGRLAGYAPDRLWHPWCCFSGLDHRPNSNIAVLTFKHYTSSTDGGLHRIHET